MNSSPDKEKRPECNTIQAAFLLDYMQKKNEPRYHFRELLIFVALVFLCYHHVLHSPWQLDDKPGIVDNYLLHITDLWPPSLIQTFIAQPFAPGSLYRPFANLSFGINWFWGGNNPFGYHLVNCIIHAVNAILLYKITLVLINLCNRRYSRTILETHAHSIALLSAVLWCINPIQIQAVTYIVQRMASLGTLFFLLSLYSYLLFRSANSKREQLLLCVLFFILALGSKENTVTLIPTLLLVEFFFFYEKSSSKRISFYSLLIVANFLFICAGFAYLISHGYFTSFFDLSGSRPFSPFQRLLTQPRVLLFYLSLIFLPTPYRLSIDHGIEHSSSLLSPLSTLPSMVAIFALLTFAFMARRRFPLASFAVLFFFINHLIESTIIPLEMVFEHRNYLPSLFLFLPISCFFVYVLDHYRQTSRIMFGLIFVLGSFLVLSFGLATYTRNTAWQTEEALWLSALKRAPDNARPLAKLGNIYGWEKEHTQENYALALAFYQKALGSYSPRVTFTASVYNNIGKLHRRYGDFDLAIDYYQKANRENSRFRNALYEIAEIYVLQGKFEEALAAINDLIQTDPRPSRYFKVKTLSLLRLDRNRQAVIASANTMLRSAVNQPYLYLTGVALLRSGNYQQAEWFLAQALKSQPHDLRILLSLLELRVREGDVNAIDSAAAAIVQQHPVKLIEKTLSDLENDNGSIPLDQKLIKPALYRAIVLDMEYFEA